MDFAQKIGYTFKDDRLLIQALTHSSYANEHGLDYDYERLEFLGDAVLELLVSELLFKKFPGMSEGDLTKKRAVLVCEASLAKIAMDIGVGKRMRLGRGEEQSGGRCRESMLCDVFEAVIGAVYIDGGARAAKKTVSSIMKRFLSDDRSALHDYKTVLQETLQKESSSPIVYKIIDEVGPAHQKRFCAQVSFGGRALGTGRGKTKKEAEQNAAFFAVENLSGNGMFTDQKA
ncbi:MAG: ribonuclease III [Clostridiales bacterium]|jgi:ribonuclease-3|nr:ribonuclease III [Clostridiales bacterium]